MTTVLIIDAAIKDITQRASSVYTVNSHDEGIFDVHTKFDDRRESCPNEEVFYSLKGPEAGSFYGLGNNYSFDI